MSIRHLQSHVNDNTNAKPNIRYHISVMNASKKYLTLPEHIDTISPMPLTL